jgi:hypothetical protein
MWGPLLNRHGPGEARNTTTLRARSHADGVEQLSATVGVLSGQQLLASIDVGAKKRFRFDKVSPRQENRRVLEVQVPFQRLPQLTRERFG